MPHNVLLAWGRCVANLRGSHYSKDGLIIPLNIYLYEVWLDHITVYGINKLRARMGSHILFYEEEAMHNVQNRFVANAA